MTGRVGMTRAFPALLVVFLAWSVPAAPLGADVRRSPAVVTAVPVATGLEFPAAFTFDPTGRIFYGERFTGEIRILDRATGTDRLFHRVGKLLTEGERGLLGLAIHPEYPERPFVYAYATRMVSGVPRNQILRIRDEGGRSASVRIIWTENRQASNVHNAGRILFGPGGRLFAVVGDAAAPANSQDLSAHAGKILRMTAAGGVPAGNPFGTVVYAYGIRNSFGFAFDPLTDRLWETENGPVCNDEVNWIRRGRNYGWGPNQTCSTPPEPPRNTNQDGPDPVLPEAFFTPTTAPTGAVFCDGCRLGAGTEGRLLFGTFKPDQILRATLSPDRRGIASIDVLYTHTSGILSMERGPGGAIHFSDVSGIYRLAQS